MFPTFSVCLECCFNSPPVYLVLVYHPENQSEFDYICPTTLTARENRSGTSRGVGHYTILI